MACGGPPAIAPKRLRNVGFSSSIAESPNAHQTCDE
jgi:hypothetical protein